ncbi:hypothetical protein AAC387_Pa04g0883 [Persea americana]
MMIKVKESTMVRPAQDTYNGSLWLSSVDLVLPRIHTPSMYFYRPNGSANFFEPQILKEALGKALVSFYPMAGRLKKSEGGRIEIDCNGKGVLFVEAETDAVLDDLGDFSPTIQLKQLIPTVEYKEDISSYALLILQLTRFRCGGVSLGVGVLHYVADGVSGIHFINHWSDVARGLDLKIQPFFDRTLLRARDPPTPKFHHVEFPPPLPMKNPPHTRMPDLAPPTTSLFKITSDQLNTLKSKTKDGPGPHNTPSFSTFELLAAHVWRCVCKARGLADDQQAQLHIPVNARARLQPPLPPGYFGNATILAAPEAAVGDLISNPLIYVASRIHDALARMDDEFLRSAIDLLHLQTDPTGIVPGVPMFRIHTLCTVNSWYRFPIYDADFGWGRPVFMGPGWIGLPGLSVILPGPIDDGSMSLIISLEPDHMIQFQKCFYDF